MAKKEKKLKNKGKGLFADFKAFINKGNAFMLAVGVVIGGAFSAIVTAFVNILLSIATWPVPGGLAGLVVPLKAVTDPQKGLGAGAHLDIGIGQSFKVSELGDKATALATKLYGAGYSDVQYVDAKNTLTSNYTIYGKNYYYNQTALINFGALIALEEKRREAYYEKHPEERPAPVEEGVPAPTTEELLTQIRDLLKEKK